MAGEKQRAWTAALVIAGVALWVYFERKKRYRETRCARPKPPPPPPKPPSMAAPKIRKKWAQVEWERKCSDVGSVPDWFEADRSRREDGVHTLVMRPDSGGMNLLLQVIDNFDVALRNVAVGFDIDRNLRSRGPDGRAIIRDPQTIDTLEKLQAGGAFVFLLTGAGADKGPGVQAALQAYERLAPAGLDKYFRDPGLAEKDHTVRRELGDWQGFEPTPDREINSDQVRYNGRCAVSVEKGVALDYMINVVSAPRTFKLILFVDDSAHNVRDVYQRFKDYSTPRNHGTYVVSIFHEPELEMVTGTIGDDPCAADLDFVYSHQLPDMEVRPNPELQAKVAALSAQGL